ncbi:MAG: branched-chain amino acid ABC transporter permease [Clostridiales bacterium]|nr:branched-chain amino acid ABC transporter permease [Clostridiales bacterium]
MQLLIQSIITGILLGGLYAAIGVGMSIIFGIMGLTNIAHGNLMILSAFFVLIFSTAMGVSLITSILIAIVLMVIIGFLFQKFLVNAVIDKGDTPALLVTFGLSIIIQNILEIIFGADARSIRSSFATVNVVDTKYFSISGAYLTNFIVAILVIVALTLIFNKTDIGRAIRATSDNTRAAELMGVHTKFIFAVAMAIAMVTACIAGVLVGNTFVFYPYSGTQYLIIAFGVVVIGGMGSIVGTLLGGMILGLAQLLGAYFFGTGNQILSGYIFMLIVLTIKPDGLLSNKKRA